MKEMARKHLQPITPGEILLEEFMKPLHLGATRLAQRIQVPRSRIIEILHGKRAITAEIALRLGKYFGISPETWLDLQTDFDQRLGRHPR
jgi:addiction module HigA family antidote